jgi:hypothetical protein
VKPAFHGSQRHLEHLGNLGIAQTLEVTQDEQAAVLGPEPAELELEAILTLAAFELRRGLANRVAVGRLERLSRWLGGPPARPRERVQRGVLSDLEQLGAEGGRAAILVEPVKCP